MRLEIKAATKKPGKKIKAKPSLHSLSNRARKIWEEFGNLGLSDLEIQNDNIAAAAAAGARY